MLRSVLSPFPNTGGGQETGRIIMGASIDRGNTPNLPARRDELIVPYGAANNAPPIVVVGGHQPHSTVGSSFVRNVVGGVLATIFLSIGGWFLSNAFWLMAQALRHGKGAKVELPEEIGTTPKPKLTLAEKGKVLFEKTKDKAADLKEGAAKPVVAGMKKAEEKVEKKAEQVIDAIKGNHSPGNGGGIFGTPEERARIAQERQNAREAAQRDVLIVRARDLGVMVDPNWSYARLNAEVGSAQMKRAQAMAPNARCPKCRFPGHLNPKKKDGVLECPKCHAFGSRKNWLIGGRR